MRKLLNDELENKRMKDKQKQKEREKEEEKELRLYMFVTCPRYRVQKPAALMEILTPSLISFVTTTKFH